MADDWGAKKVAKLVGESVDSTGMKMVDWSADGMEQLKVKIRVVVRVAMMANGLVSKKAAAMAVRSVALAAVLKVAMKGAWRVD